MWIVRLALRRPYTFTVMAILIVLMGIVTISRMATDIFPKIDIPVVSVIWSFPGVAPEEMEKRFVTVTERAMTTTVNDIEHIESQSYNGVSVIKVFFHEGAKVEAGVAQITSITQTLLRILPPGTTPPLILQYSASNVPILQLGLTSKTLSEQDLYDLGLNFIRTQLATVQGAQVPLPYGGKSRQVMVDIDPEKLFGKGLSPADVSSALNAQNVILPAGTEKIGDREYNVRLNSSPELLQALNDLPIKQVNNATVYIRDVAHVRDGFAVQTNIVAQNRVRSALLTVLKSASASTLDIINRVKAALPRIKATLPPELEITQLFDQSIFVRAAINGVLKEGVIAACLTALMILLFLGSWRSTLVVATSIPLSILCSILILSALGQTMNLMTLGRTRARRRHFGGRRHGRDREHPPQSCDEETDGARHPRRRIANCSAGVRFNSLYLHRFCTDLFLEWHGQIPFSTAGHGSDLRDARFLFSFAHGRADDGEISFAWTSR
jgi:multidrug efflux pump subunit AcrB